MRLEAPPTTGPERDGAAKKASPWGRTGHTFGVYSLVVDSYLQALTQDEVYQRIQSRVCARLETTHDGGNKGTN